jgi:hypothetical protein
LVGALAALSLATVYSTASLQVAEGPAARQGPSATITGPYAPEPGPDALGWSWLGDGGSLRVRSDSAPFWIGFRAASLRTPRRITVGGAGGSATVTVGTRPAVQVLGPFRKTGERTLPVTVSPTAKRAGREDPRRVSVNLSTPRLSSTPVVPVPGQGFYYTEFTADGGPFNWLRDRGAIDVRSADSAVRQVWLAFEMRTVDFRRSVRISGPGYAGTVSTSFRSGSAGVAPVVRAGPFKLVAGAARVSIRSLGGARRYGADARQMSVRIDRLAAAPTAEQAMKLVR